MKILQLANRIPWPLKDGGAIGIYNLACSYAEAGHELTLFCLNTVKHHIDTSTLPSPFHTAFRLVEAPVDNRVRLLPALANLFSNDSYNISRFWSESVAQQLQALTEAVEPDLVHFDGPFMLPYLKVIRKAAPNARCIMRAHNVEHLIWERMAASCNSALKAWYFRLLARRLKAYEIEGINLLDGFLPISDIDLQSFRKFGVTTPALVSPAGLQFGEVLPPIPTPQAGSFSFIGSLDWQPNTEALDWLLAEVWPQVVTHFPHFQLHIAGRNMPKRYFDLASTNIHVHGEVADSQAFLRNHGPLLVPLLSGSGVRIKILEALAAGQAIISTKTGAEGLSLQPNTHLLLADTAESFARAILDLGQHPERCFQLGKNGQQLVFNTYSQHAQTEQIIQWVKGIEAKNAQ